MHFKNFDRKANIQNNLRLSKLIKKKISFSDSVLNHKKTSKKYLETLLGKDVLKIELPKSSFITVTCRGYYPSDMDVGDLTYCNSGTKGQSNKIGQKMTLDTLRKKI